tara:strand:+ start:400 stop:669 length:270 start_codon:yes stop_codon:yes gene_type:complete
MTESEIFIRAVHQWVVRFGMTEMPEDVIEWYDEEIGTTDPDYVLDYSEEDTDDELNLLDSYEEIEYISEDRENSQELALELMEQKYELE